MSLSDKELRGRTNRVLEGLSDLDNDDKMNILCMAIDKGIPVWEDEESSVGGE